MPSVTIDARQVGRLLEQLKGANGALKNSLRNALIEGSYAVHANAVTSIKRGKKTGYLYDWRAVSGNMKPDSFRMIRGRAVPVKMRNKPHRASRRGEAPATDTGYLSNNITVNPKRGLHVEIVANANYSGHLEDARGANRPFMLPALLNAEGDIDAAIDRAIMGAY